MRSEKGQSPSSSSVRQHHRSDPLPGGQGRAIASAHYTELTIELVAPDAWPAFRPLGAPAPDKGPRLRIPAGTATTAFGATSAPALCGARLRRSGQPGRPWRRNQLGTHHRLLACNQALLPDRHRKAPAQLQAVTKQRSSGLVLPGPGEVAQPSVEHCSERPPFGSTTTPEEFGSGDGGLHQFGNLRLDARAPVDDGKGDGPDLAFV